MPRPALQTETDWWNNLKNDDPNALGHLYDAYVDKLFISAMYITEDRELAKDALQEVFIEIWQYRKTIGTISNSKAYLTKVLSRIIYKKLRKVRLITLDENSEAFSAEHNAENIIVAREDSIEKRERLNIAISKLTKRQKLILELSFKHSYTYEQIADILELKYQSVSNLACRTIRRLREAMSPLIIVCYLFF